MRLAALAPGAIGDIHSLDQYRAAGIYAFRAASMIGAAVGGLALLLTLIWYLWRTLLFRDPKDQGDRHPCRPWCADAHRHWFDIKAVAALDCDRNCPGQSVWPSAVSRLIASIMVFMRGSMPRPLQQACCWLPSPRWLPDTSRPAGQLESTQFRRFATTEKCRFDSPRKKGWGPTAATVSTKNNLITVSHPHRILTIVMRTDR